MICLKIILMSYFIFNCVCEHVSTDVLWNIHCEDLTLGLT